jgi:hypothetical protein
MPSKSKDPGEKPNLVEKKRSRHPFLWVFSIVILVIIVVTFIGGPLLTGFGQSNRIIFGRWDGKPIEYREDNYFARQRDMLAERYQAMFQQVDDTNIEWQLYQIWNSAFEQTVVHTAILDQAERSGLRVSDNAVDRALTYYPGYQRDGRFNPEVYRNTPNSEKVSVRNYYKASLIHQQWVEDVFGTRTSSMEEEFLIAMSSPERSFSYVIWELDSFPVDQVEAFAMDQKELFSEGNFSRISLGSDKKSAEAVYEQLQSGSSSFEEVAQNHSSDIYAEKGGEMGYVMRYALQSDITREEDLDAVFNLEPGAYSDLVETPYGWAVYQSNGPVRPADFSSEATVDRVRNYILVNERGLVEDHFLAQGRQFAALASEDFQGTAAQEGKTAHQTDYFPINYGELDFLKSIRTIDGAPYLQAVAGNERILTALFSLGENEISEPLVTGNNVAVFTLEGERSAPESVTDRIPGNVESIINRMTDRQTRNLFMNSDKLENNFMQVFSSVFLSRE